MDNLDEAPDDDEDQQPNVEHDPSVIAGLQAHFSGVNEAIEPCFLQVGHNPASDYERLHTGLQHQGERGGELHSPEATSHKEESERKRSPLETNDQPDKADQDRKRRRIGAAENVQFGRTPHRLGFPGRATVLGPQIDNGRATNNSSATSQQPQQLGPGYSISNTATIRYDATGLPTTFDFSQTLGQLVPLAASLPPPQQGYRYYQLPYAPSAYQAGVAAAPTRSATQEEEKSDSQDFSGSIPNISATTGSDSNSNHSNLFGYASSNPDNSRNAITTGPVMNNTMAPNAPPLGSESLAWGAQDALQRNMLALATPMPAAMPVFSTPNMNHGAAIAIPQYLLNGQSWLHLVNAAHQTMLRGTNPASVGLVAATAPSMPVIVGGHHQPTQPFTGTTTGVNQIQSNQAVTLTAQSPGICMYLACDSENLSDYQVLVRKQIEYFEANPEDVSTNVQGRKKQLYVGQVGLRCKHCCITLPLHRRGKGSVYFPMKLRGLYQAAQNMATTHLSATCICMEDHLQAELVRLRDFRITASGGKKYWADAGKAVGLYETETGLRLSHRTRS